MADESYIFGDIPGITLGAQFPDREALMTAGVHRPPEAGISGRPDVGAESIVLNGGYDNDDQGDVIFYCGQGGDRDNSDALTKDQDWLRGNGGLRKSCIEGLPVRVIRGSNGNPEYSPDTGFRYDGLYLVSDWWEEVGKGGFRQCRFTLTRIVLDLEDVALTKGDGGAPAEWRFVTTQRRVRNTAITQWVKDLYKHTCQVCGLKLVTPGGPYAEGAHIVPLGRPHGGPDSRSNVLCLCPTCHVKLDRGSLTISDSLEVVDLMGDQDGSSLQTRESHHLDKAMLARHRAIHSSGS